MEHHEIMRALEARMEVDRQFGRDLEEVVKNQEWEQVKNLIEQALGYLFTKTKDFFSWLADIWRSS